MYEHHFGLRRKPFELCSGPDFYYESERQRETVAALIYSLDERRGLLTVVGDPGTGKTTLMRMLAASLVRKVATLVISHTTLNRDEFLAMLCGEIAAHSAGNRRRLSSTAQGDVASQPPNTRVEQLSYVRRFVESLERDGKPAPVLIVDEAQHLAEEVLDEISLLSNLERSSGPSLQIVLAGQTGLQAKLDRPTLASLKQRIAVPLRVEPLDDGQTAAYIAHRLRAAGAGDNEIFTRGAIDVITSASDGVPRLINKMGEWCLVNGYGTRRDQIDESIALESTSDLELPLRRIAPVESPPRLDASRPPQLPPPRASALTSRAMLVPRERRIERVEPGPAYGVLVATYRVYSKARAHAGKLSRSGHDASAIRSTLPDGNPVTQVMVGVSADVHRVRATAERLAHEGLENVEVTKLEGWAGKVDRRPAAGSLS